MKITISDAQSHFAELLKKAEMGETVIVTRHGKPVARIEGIQPPSNLPRIGALKGQIQISDDFDAPLEAFSEYIQLWKS